MYKETELYATHYIYRVEDVAIANIHRYGDKGIIYGMLGKDLLIHLMNDMEYGILKDEGIKYLEGYVSRTFGKAIEYVIRHNDNIRVKYTEECHMDNRNSVWIQVEICYNKL